MRMQVLGGEEPILEGSIFTMTDVTEVQYMQYLNKTRITSPQTPFRHDCFEWP